jgi:hypothetical protein
MSVPVAVPDNVYTHAFDGSCKSRLSASAQAKQREARAKGSRRMFLERVQGMTVRQREGQDSSVTGPVTGSTASVGDGRSGRRVVAHQRQVYYDGYGKYCSWLADRSI